MLEQMKAYLANAIDMIAAFWNSIAGAIFEGFLASIEWTFEYILPVSTSYSSITLASMRSDEFESTFRMILSGIVSVVLLYMAYRLLRKGKSSDVASLADTTRRPRFYGVLGIVVLIVFFGGWSTLAPLASAAIAPGIVSPDGNRKTVEHLEGGIVKKIHVREGERVTVNQPLLTLEDVQARAQYAQLQKRYFHLLATEARLSAERSQEDVIKFPEELGATTDPEANQAVQTQLELFNSHRTSLASHLRILETRIKQLEEQNIGLNDVLSAQNRELDFLTQEVASVQTLLDSGLERRPRYLALLRSQAELEADQASIRAQIAENKLKVGETEIQLLNIIEQAVDSANDQLADVQRVLAELRSQLPSREDILHRTVVRAPLAGVVMNVRADTESGVIGAGEPILEIVPDDAALIIDARVRPNDIDRVTPGMETRVVLSAYKQRNLPHIHGTLRTISADRLIEDRTGEPYFLAKVKVNAEEIEAIKDIQLVPGMPAEVMILNGSQTLLDYLLEPFVASLRRGLSES